MLITSEKNYLKGITFFSVMLINKWQFKWPLSLKHGDRKLQSFFHNFRRKPWISLNKLHRITNFLYHILSFKMVNFKIYEMELSESQSIKYLTPPECVSHRELVDRAKVIWVEGFLMTILVSYRVRPVSAFNLS